jgi:hypothetical protein
MNNEVGYGKPPKEHRFKPGDKRINRDGRPATAASLSALAKRIGHEVATKKNGEVLTGPDGKPMTVIEAILRQWAQNPRQQADFVDRAYGKVPQGVEPQDVINWTPDEWREEADRRTAQVSDTLATFDDE